MICLIIGENLVQTILLSIFDQIFNFVSKMMEKIFDFWQNLDVWQNFRFLAKFRCWTTFRFLAKHWIFDKFFHFLIKISTCDKMFECDRNFFLTKFRLWTNCRFLPKIPFFSENSIFWPEPITSRVKRKDGRNYKKRNWWENICN